MFNLQRFAKEYGLLGSADKTKIDALSATYVAKSELAGYLRYEKSGDDYNILNDDGEVIYKITGKADPQLTVSPSEVTLYNGTSTTLAISRQGDGAITATATTTETGTFTATVNGSEITVANADITSGSGVVTVKVAGTSEYKAASISVPVTFKTKLKPKLTITPATVTASGGKTKTATATISRLGNGEVSISTNDYHFSLDGLNLEYSNSEPLGNAETTTCTVIAAETDEYESATAVWTVYVPEI